MDLVFDWLDAMGVESQQSIERLIGDTGSLENLRTAARANETACRARTSSGGIRIVAGHAIDTSGNFDCWGWECRMHQVDELLSRVWLYFDQVVVSDWLTPLHVPIVRTK